MLNDKVSRLSEPPTPPPLPIDDIFQDSVLAYKQRNKVGRFAPKIDLEEKERETTTAVGIPVGSRCKVASTEAGLDKRGTVRFSGPTGFAAGHWVGVEYDEPMGKNDGRYGFKPK